jgi:predicted Zn-dependent protease with MMP-like domain
VQFDESPASAGLSASGGRFVSIYPPDRSLPHRRGVRRAIVRDMSDAPEFDEFESLVVDAIDRLPVEFQEVLAKVAVVISNLGDEVHAYGQYFGDGVARENYEDRIVIYRDTLERDFGHDRDLLARQVEQTLRHELAHHLGWDEGGVGGLGL